MICSKLDCMAGEIGERIGQLLDHMELKPADLVRRLRTAGVEVSIQRISNWTRGLHDPSPQLIAQISDALNIQPSVLLNPQSFEKILAVPSIRRTMPSQEAKLPKIAPIQAGAVWTDPFQSDDTETVPIDLYREDRFCTTVEGDSMMPFLHPGDLAVFERLNKPARVGDIILARKEDGSMTIKRLGHDGRTFTLDPINTSYPPMTAEQWINEGLLVGRVRDVGTQRTTTQDSYGLREK